jgi:crotonobetainyl-CoA:carnitine CoA-transferase CaiB-like acyl-CoA transferase
MPATAPRRTLASGLRVVEVGESITAAIAGMVLADFGADVVVIEPPRGSRLRELPAFRMWARAKDTTRIDLATAEGRRSLEGHVGTADVVIAALEPATADRLGVDGATLCAADQRLVHCEITGFGRGHPSSNVPGHEGIVTARAGRAHEFSVLFDGERPAFPAVPVATYGASMLALQGIFAALTERERTGRGQRIETSLLRALSVYDLANWAPGASRALRLADVPMLPYTVARTADGVWLQFGQNSPQLFRAFVRSIGLDHLLAEPRFASAPSLGDPDDARALRALLLRRIGERTWDEWRQVFADEPDVSAEPFAWPGDALSHPQLLHTGDAVELDDPELGPVRQLGPLADISAAPAEQADTSAAPAEQADTSAAPAEQADTPAAPAEQADTSAAPAEQAQHARGFAARTPGADSARALLQGVTVLELATWIATPMATALLAELGARVIKIEPLAGDPMRSHGYVGMKCVQGKESITLDLKTDAGREIVHRLVERADALAHNYRPGVPERLGIDDATLRALNPRLVYLYAASYGSTGPMAPRPAFHVTAGAVCGGALAQCGRDGAPGAEAELSDDELAAWSQRLSRCNESNPDFNAALGAAAALTMALYARERTGLGQSLETRMMLSNAYTLAEHFVDYAGRPDRVLPDAQLYGLHALSRLYRAGDGWVYLAAGADDDFARLCAVAGRAGLADDARFRDRGGRERHDGELAAELERLFSERGAASWERDLTAAGVACVQAHDGPYAAYVFDSPWACELGHVDTAAATGLGPYPRYGRVVRTERDVGPLGAADHAGAQTRAILAEIGYDDGLVADLLGAGVVGEPARRQI